MVGNNYYGAVSNVYNTGSVSGNSEVGGVVGGNYGGTVSNVDNTGSVSGSGFDVGGVVGKNDNGIVSNAYNMGSVSGDSEVGGVVGGNYGGTVSNVYNTGSVSGNSEVGGVVGGNYGGTVSNVYNTGIVSGLFYVGGVVGNNYYGAVSNVYNTGSVDGNSEVGGVVGGNNGGNINNAYYDNQTCNNCNSYGTGKTLAELANLAIGSEDGFPLLEGETESPWAKGIYYDKATGKLANSELPYLKSLPKPQDVEMEFNVKDNVIQISSTDDLKNFAKLVNEYDIRDVDAELTTSITLNSNLLGENNANVDAETGEYTGNTPANVWTPIGTSEKPYTGTFDGNGYTIRGLYFNDEDTNYVGLFGYIDESAKVQNVGVVDSYFKGYQYVGGVGGKNNNGTISNVYNTGAVSGEFDYVGGVVGENNNGTVSNVYNTGSVSGDYEVGGVVGENNNGTVSNVYNTGSVSGGSEVSGVVGRNNGTISNAYNTGSVNGEQEVGGVVGFSLNGTVSNVYNTGSVSGNSEVGGVVGQNDGTVSNGFFNTAYYSGNAIGGGTGTANTVVGKTSTELANLTVGNGGDFPLLEGETESPWAKDISYDKATGKLTSTLPYLKNLPVVPDAETILSFTVASGVIQISTAEDLKNFAKLVNEYHITDVDAELTTNLTVNSNLLGENNANVDAETGEYTGNTPANVWTPIGTSEKPYTGTFDGNGYTIRGLYFNDEDTNYVGLFGYIDESAKVQNVGVVDSYFKGYQYVGGVVGYNDGGTVCNVYNTGFVSGYSEVGGVVGYNDGGTVCNVYNTGFVSIAVLNILAGDKVTVNNGATLIVTGTLTNTNAANLIIEDGGQLITSSTGVKATIEKNIAQATNGEITNWYLISSPVGTVNTSVVAVNDINLYAYNEANLAWNGYLGSNGFDNLVSGKGYLYRNSEDVTLSFTGTVATPGTVAGISLTCNNEDNKYAGFNLLGNPYSQKISSNCISLSNGATFTGVYTLGTDGGWYPSVSADIDPCEGFLVKVDKTTTATFGTPAKGTTYNNDYIQFTVANSQYEDVTYALFSKGNGLTKINHRNADIPMLYINQNDRDYAIANFSDNTKSFSLNFKAMTTGKYTLSYNTTGEYNYLHIIDRLTSADVDMLVDGEYSFIATPSDNTNRFIVRLEYMPNYSESNAEIFAFQNGNEVLVSGSGELQIFDVTGRSVMTTTINGAESIRIPAQGVYILRLVGSEIKTQKIVVR